MEIVTRYAPGGMPCRDTMCDDCEGMGVEPDGGVCEACDGSRRKPGIAPWRAAFTETLTGYADPLRFALFMWREYGWDLGSPMRGLVMTWRDNTYNRGSFWRFLWARLRGEGTGQ